MISAKRASNAGVRSEWVITQKRSVRMASTTAAATSPGSLPTSLVICAQIAARHPSAISVRASGAMPAGRLRSASIICVLVALGHSTDTPIGSPAMATSWRSVSESDTTPTLLTAYGPMNATPLRIPATDAVFTMCAGVPCARITGRNVCTVLIGPQRFTPSTQRQSSMVWSAIALKVDTPAMLASTSTRPCRPSTASRSASTDARSDTSVRTASAPGISAAAASSAEASTSTSTGWAPRAATAWASARPIPLAPPVTTTTFPCSVSIPALSLAPAPRPATRLYGTPVHDPRGNLTWQRRSPKAVSTARQP